MIRDARSVYVKPVGKNSIYVRIHRLMQRAGLITLNSQKRYELNVHSLRKYFKTQLTVKGVQTEYVEFMMGHVISTYNDIKSLGVEKLRDIYKKANLRIYQKSQIGKLDQLKTLAEALGLDSEKLIYQGEIVDPHRTVIGENREIVTLQDAIRQTLVDLVSKRAKKNNVTPESD